MSRSSFGARIAVILSLIAVLGVSSVAVRPQPAAAVSSGIVISQVYGGGSGPRDARCAAEESST